jgi:hypothetical protein
MTVSFAEAIAPLFTDQDVACMNRFGVSLSDYSHMSDPGGNAKFADHANARNVYAHLTGAAAPRMPIGGPYWPDEQIKLFAQWMTDGFCPERFHGRRMP